MPTYNVAGVHVDFPFEPYSLQLVYMEKVVLALQKQQNALLESPTGTGKTLSLLCAALGWRQAQIDAAKRAASSQSRVDALAQQYGEGSNGDCRRLPRIVYASRTHSQLQQVARELRRTVYRPTVCVLASRQHMCVHHEVSKLSGAAQNRACQALVAAQSCKFHRQVKQSKQRGALPAPEAEVPDIEDLLAFGKAAQLCPFYYVREVQHEADVLFVPYNYLIDAQSRKALNISLQSDVVIFDEAHNIERAFADAASFDLTTTQLASCIREVRRRPWAAGGRPCRAWPVLRRWTASPPSTRRGRWTSHARTRW